MSPVRDATLVVHVDPQLANDSLKAALYRSMSQVLRDIAMECLNKADAAERAAYTAGQS